MDGLDVAVETSQKIAERRVNPDIVPFPDTQFTGALGVLIFTKIAEALSGESQVGIKTQALERLVALCKGEGTAKENLYLSIQKKVFPELAFNLSDADATIRRLATEVLVYFASSLFGRNHLLTEDIMSKLGRLLSDEDLGVRLNVYTVLANLANAPSSRGIEDILKHNLQAILVAKISQEEQEEAQVAAMEVLTALVTNNRICYKACVAGGLVETVVAKLAEEPSSAVQAAACNCISAVAYEYEGKDESVKRGAMAQLVPLLSSNDNAVRMNSSAALMHVTNSLLGKNAALEVEAPKACMERIFDPVEVVAANSMQAIANMAEHPKVRFSELFLDESTLEKLKQAGEGRGKLAEQGSKIAREKILWRP